MFSSLETVAHKLGLKKPPADPGVETIELDVEKGEVLDVIPSSMAASNAAAVSESIPIEQLQGSLDVNGFMSQAQFYLENWKRTATGQQPLVVDPTTKEVVDTCNIAVSYTHLRAHET